MRKRLRVLLIVVLIILLMIPIVRVIFNDISARNKIRKKIYDFYGDSVESVSITYSFKLKEYVVLAKKRNSDIHFSIDPDTMRNTYTRSYWESWMKEQATLLVQNNFSKNAYCSKIILLGHGLRSNPSEKIMDYDEYMIKQVDSDVRIIYKIQDSFYDVEEKIDSFLNVLDNSDLIFDIVCFDFADGVELEYSYKDKSVKKRVSQ
ncbi:MAG: hypothetical protein IJB70_02385 [Clostridia bacterium]|nr:hypothetical protein [Clostridia bacterium]